MFDDATPFGLAVTALYFVAAWRCVVAARAGPPGLRGYFWTVCAVVLLALGLNKQLDLQTLLIRVLRASSRAGGWYSIRRGVEAAGFALLLLAALAGGVWSWRVRRRWRRDAARLRALAGLGLLSVYVLVRAGDILHVRGESLVMTGIVHAIEPAGLLLVLAGAAMAIRRGAETS